jgi:heat shock protein beta
MRFHRLLWSAIALLAVCAFQERHYGLANADEGAETEAQKDEEPVAYTPPKGSETFKFEAEVHRMLDIVVNSLYQNKDVFLRELISNASDALDKIRFLSLTNAKLLEGEDKFQVQIEYDADEHTLTVRDTGIGMTHEDLVENLGTVARSGTTKFLEAISENSKQDISGMIGQFGVGFYSTFLVADRVSVASKHPSSDTQYVWESVNGKDEFSVYQDPRGNTLGRGTEITLHLKEDCLEYADANRLRDLITHYSEFITHPISLRITRTEIVEVEDEEVEEEAKEEEAEKKEEDDEFEVSDDEPVEEKPKETKEVTVQEWEEINQAPAIWTREKDSISDDEYQDFWKILAKEEYTNATSWSHFNAEGNINFKSILYLPGEIPSHYRFGNIDAVPGGLKLYVRKVLISDEFELLPRYLGFIRGVVDSEDLPLNVNRETLQESKIIQVIKKKLVRKALEMIRTFSKEEAKVDEEEASEEDADHVTEKEPPYIDWYKKFSVNLKMGVIDDEPNRGRLMKLLRFKTSKSDGKWISLEDYVNNMKEWQTDIYFMAGMSIDEVKKSRFLERFQEKDVEVLFLTDPVDEYVVSNVRDFDGKKFVAISSESVKLKDEDENLTKRREKFYQKKFKPLTKWLKKLYGQSVMRVSISKRLGSTPAIVSSSEYGHSANMERIMRAQAFQQGIEENPMMRAMKIFEINPRHPLVLKLLEGCPPEKEEEGADPFVVAKETEEAAWLLHDMAMLAGGFQLTDTEAHTKRMLGFLQSQLAVESLELEPEVDPPEEEEEAPEVDLDGLDGLNMADFDMDNMEHVEL